MQTSVGKMDAAGPIAHARGASLRALCFLGGREFQGLSQALRMAFRDPLLRRRPERLDVAYNINRHISAPGVAALIREVERLVDVRMDELELQTNSDIGSLTTCTSHYYIGDGNGSHAA